ncbi:MAG TPA: sulfatase-like hydrolase/transferase [Longimicrobiales bacterium]|nr:sulfatase-like hydrolase/transferase [Longimicrobiales bacterium]
MTKEQETLRSADVLWIALAVALLAGLAEVGVRLLQHNIFGGRVWVSQHFVWMGPVSLAALTMVAALALVAGSRILRRAVPVRVALAVFIFLGIAGPMLSVGRLHRAAMLIVALGIAVQSARLLSARSRFIRKHARPAAVASSAVVLLLAGFIFGRQALAERRGLAALPPSTGDAPNVLLIILDTVRAASMSVYGYHHPTTPNLEEIAAEGTVFEHAWSTSPWTLPSHSSIFTGRFAHELSADLVTPLDETFPTVAEHFRDRGYVTAGFAANLLYTTREVGLSRGFVHYDDYPLSAAVLATSSSLGRLLAGQVAAALGSDQKLVRRSGESMTNTFLSWARQPRDRPFFAFINYFDAHAPYLPPDSLAGRFGPRRSGRALHDLSNREHWTAAEIDAERAAYDEVLADLDGQLGRLFDGMRELGMLDNTIVLISSDHGEQFGEHGLMDHGNSLYRPLLEVPLIIRFPARVPAGERISTPVSLRDIAVTLVDLADQHPSPFPGTPLSSLWSGGEQPPSPVLSEVREGIRTVPWLPLAKGDMQSLVADDHHYIRDGAGTEEVYHIDDVAEASDLSHETDVVLSLRSLIARLVGETYSGSAAGH